jgi:hypothetical protein
LNWHQPIRAYASKNRKLFYTLQSDFANDCNHQVLLANVPSMLGNEGPVF